MGRASRRKKEARQDSALERSKHKRCLNCGKRRDVHNAVWCAACGVAGRARSREVAWPSFNGRPITPEQIAYLRDEFWGRDPRFRPMSVDHLDDEGRELPASDEGTN